MPPVARRGRPRRGTSTLTREAIVLAAIAMAEEEGLDAVAMRGLARRLGVDPMSLYHHVDNRDALLNAIAEHILAALELPTPTGELRADVRAIAHAFRTAALRHPNCATLVLTRQLASTAALAPTNAALGVLRAAGFTPERAVHGMRAVLAYLVGSLLREAEAGPSFSGANLGGVSERFGVLRDSGQEYVAEAATHLATCDHLTEFDFGLDLLITALEG
ncbi:AcrR family transcriptional regulator [Crossiella equi]|uniref:AcrR family transcriptional regulator n=1 Tax=Crossiella equi TaxID=130796 RepID=A0ABS5AQ03_9PSEU|nr:TetR/AcrR family transcriptional regulator C-terminal domain-containing protein [Crossiella equi]MBP2478651.1 AcrR family transcriptional regulator [Crossiella equi]